MDSVQSMASSSSSTMPSSEQTSQLNSQTETEMESSKARHWSQLGYSTTDSDWSAETNFRDFALLKSDPQCGRFFRDFEALEVGEKISEGAQADIYEARNKCDGPFNLVVKVMKGDAPLKAFQAQWPIGMLSARSKDKCVYFTSLITILGGTVLRDKKLLGRFAFVMFRRWGDLRLLIDRRMKQERTTLGPFPIDKVIHLMLSIAEDMKTLNDYDILHRDLKASNVLVWGEVGKDISFIAPLGQVEWIGSLVADFECSVGVLGTSFWRAPEILEQLKDRVPSSKVRFTHASDVYSYGMTCYEIVTGCIPYDGLGGEDMISQILNGQRPELPHELPEFVRNIIVGCWHSNPLERLTFSDICEALKLKRGPNLASVVIDNTSERVASIVKVEQWNNPQPPTLLEVMQKLMDMELLVLKAYDSSSSNMITQYFEVTDCNGRKVVDDKSIANITKTLSLPGKMKWTSETPWTSIDRNTRVYIVEVVVEGSAGFLWEGLSRLLVATNFQVLLVGCGTRKGRVKCVMYVGGARMGTLLWKLRHDTRLCPGRFKIIIHRGAPVNFSHFNTCLHNLNSLDLTPPCSSSNIHVHQRKEFEEGYHFAEVVVCLLKSESLVHMVGTLADMNYKISRARIKYPGPYKFLTRRSNKDDDIDVGTRTEDESKKIRRILDVAFERGCPEGNGKLSISGAIEELHDDLMRNFLQNGLIVTGGLVHSSYYPGYLEFFVTENRTTGPS